MATWIAFLRAINLGAKRKFSPAQVVAATEAAGFTDVATHINTGNVRFSTTMRSPQRIADALEQAYAADRGFEVPVVLMAPDEVAAIADSLDDVAAGHAGKHYVSLVRDAPTAAAASALEGKSVAGCRVVVRDRAVHLLVDDDYRSAAVSNATVEKLLGVATNRNRTVIAAIAAKWCGTAKVE
ncbi:DUF1697 domain-containing protein [Mariniluteicoccus flavus]